jgi:hypothetical protein
MQTPLTTLLPPFRYDKPFTIIVYANGLGSINGEHTWADAMVVVKQQVRDMPLLEHFEFIGNELLDSLSNLQDYVMKSVADELKIRGRPIQEPPSAAYRKPYALLWKLDATSLQSVEIASTNIRLLIRKFDLRVLSFPHFGRQFCKRIKVTPDFFMQVKPRARSLHDSGPSILK